MNLKKLLKYIKEIIDKGLFAYSDIEYGLINDFYVLKLKRRINDFQSGKRMVHG
jgi:hypothetical protein